jgi:dTMP kinase
LSTLQLLSTFCEALRPGDSFSQDSHFSIEVQVFEEIAPPTRAVGWRRASAFPMPKPALGVSVLRAVIQGGRGAGIMRQMSQRGRFITLEGLDGTGKSTQMRMLAAALRAAGHKVVETREPGGTPTGEKIRKVLLDSGTAGLSPLAEMALMFASRAQHVAEVIEPALAAGSMVLCDRFTDSTEAYQGSGRRLGSEPVRELHRVLCGNLQPDLTLLLDSDLVVSLGRARRRNRRAPKSASRSHDENRFEQETRAFFARVREGYLAIAKREPERVKIVDARSTPEQTHQRIWEVVQKHLRTGLGSM